MFTQNLPFRYARDEAISPEGVSPSSLHPETDIGSMGPGSCFADPTSLQYSLEGPGTPFKEEDDEDDEEETEILEPPLEPAPKRKRGRPRQNKRESVPSSSKKVVSQRVPHNLVERKYRESLNVEMERLRVNVPTLQHDSTSLAGPPKFSKASILAAAVDYIKTLEASAERLAGENEELMQAGW